MPSPSFRISFRCYGKRKKDLPFFDAKYNTELDSAEKRRVHEAFLEADAIERGIDYTPWRRLHIPKKGFPQNETIWILSDDGVVFPIYGIRFTRDKQLIVESPFGHFGLPRRRHLGKINVLSSSKVRTEDYVRSKRQPRTHLRGNIIQMAAHGLDADEIVSLLCVSSASERADYIKSFYKSEECVKMVREEVKEILSRMGLTEERVVQMLLELTTLRKKKRDASNMLRATENLIDMHGLKDKGRKRPPPAPWSWSLPPKTSRSWSASKKRIKLEQKDAREGN